MTLPRLGHTAPNYPLPKFGEGVVVGSHVVELARVVRSAPLLAAQAWSWPSSDRAARLSARRRDVWRQSRQTSPQKRVGGGGVVSRKEQGPKL